MKIIIDIPKELYNNIQKGCGIYPYRLVYNAIKNGTPLPEGHVIKAEGSDKEEQTLAWMYRIFNKDEIKTKTEQWTKEAEEAGMTLTEYLEAISPLNNKRMER